MAVAECRMCKSHYYVRNGKLRCWICDLEYQEGASKAARMMINGFNWRHSFVYFAHSPANGLIKIGASNVPEDRMYALRTEFKDPMISYIGFIPAQEKSEALMHRRFKDIRVHREWFRADDCLLKYIVMHAYVLSYIRAIYQFAWAAAKHQYYADYAEANPLIVEPDSIAPKRVPPPNAFSDAAYLRTGVLPARIAIVTPSTIELEEAA